MHNYDIAWDYTVDFKVDKDIKKFVKAEIKRLKNDLLPKLKCFKNFRVDFVRFDNADQIAVYINGTRDFPVIGIDVEAHKEAIKQYGGEIFSAIKTSILHELAHGIQEYKGKEFDETEAEEFAFEYEVFGIINKI